MTVSAQPTRADVRFERFVLDVKRGVSASPKFTRLAELLGEQRTRTQTAMQSPTTLARARDVCGYWQRLDEVAARAGGLFTTAELDHLAATHEQRVRVLGAHHYALSMRCLHAGERYGRDPLRARGPSAATADLTAEVIVASLTGDSTAAIARHLDVTPAYVRQLRRRLRQAVAFDARRGEG